MFYKVDTGKIKLSSFQSGSDFVHELRHYGSVVNVFRTTTPYTFIPAILEEHFSTLTVKSFYRDAIKRFAITQLGVDISEFYGMFVNGDINKVCFDRNYSYVIRDFDKAFKKKNPTILVEGSVSLKILIHKGKIFLRPSISHDKELGSSLFIPLSDPTLKHLKGDDLAAYLSPLLEQYCGVIAGTHLPL